MPYICHASSLLLPHPFTCLARVSCCHQLTKFKNFLELFKIRIWKIPQFFLIQKLNTDQLNFKSCAHCQTTKTYGGSIWPPLDVRGLISKMFQKQTITSPTVSETVLYFICVVIYTKEKHFSKPKKNTDQLIKLVYHILSCKSNSGIKQG